MEEVARAGDFKGGEAPLDPRREHLDVAGVELRDLIRGNRRQQLFFLWTSDAVHVFGLCPLMVLRVHDDPAAGCVRTERKIDFLQR